jgi:hypothetical protein
MADWTLAYRQLCCGETYVDGVLERLEILVEEARRSSDVEVWPEAMDMRQDRVAFLRYSKEA